MALDLDDMSALGYRFYRVDCCMVVVHHFGEPVLSVGPTACEAPDCPAALHIGISVARKPSDSDVLAMQEAVRMVAEHEREPHAGESAQD